MENDEDTVLSLRPVASLADCVLPTAVFQPVLVRTYLADAHCICPSATPVKTVVEVVKIGLKIVLEAVKMGTKIIAKIGTRTRAKLGAMVVSCWPWRRYL